MISTDNKMIRISNSIKDSGGLLASNLRAKNVAEALAVDYIEGKPGSYAEAVGAKEMGTMVVYKAHSPSWLPFIVFVVAIVLGCLFIYY